MKRSSPGTVAVALLAILVGLPTFFLARHFFSTVAIRSPDRCQTDGNVPVADATRCDSQQPPAAESSRAPTLAPPQHPQPSDADFRVDQQPHGQVIYVHVEAEQVGPEVGAEND